MADPVALNGTTRRAAALVDEAAWAAAREYGVAPHTAVEETSRVRWLITGVPYEGLNGVYWAADTEVRHALRPFHQAEVPMLWHVGPTSPRDLSAALRSVGLSHYGDEPGMLLDLDQSSPRRSSPEQLEIRTVGTEAQLRAWVRIWAGPTSQLITERLVALRAPAAFGVGARTPHLLGVLHGEPVACAAVWVGRVSGLSPRPTAWLEHVAVRIAARRQGFGTAMTLACLDIARRRGAGHATLTASPAAVSLYRALGFRPVCTVNRYLWTPRG
ncbi:MAG TPA: GNAT family N-acetyltransferase [Micromonosporaceae bacterium]|jgi:ribosomal protein S18 acetylase RimI-like enzyme|nr:GNAT family N-acetyltransferase [Micromonosporaceae bacterium]